MFCWERGRWENGLAWGTFQGFAVDVKEMFAE